MEKAAEAAKPKSGSKPKPRKPLSPETVALIRSKVDEDSVPAWGRPDGPSYPDESQLSTVKVAEMDPWRSLRG